MGENVMLSIYASLAKADASVQSRLVLQLAKPTALLRRRFFQSPMFLLLQ